MLKSAKYANRLTFGWVAGEGSSFLIGSPHYTTGVQSCFKPSLKELSLGYEGEE
jgi:hypothetical protein